MEKYRVLVVDDEAAVRHVVTALLAYDGYATAEASSAKEALDLLRDGLQCDVVMSDVMMPETNGLALLDAIKMDFPATPVILCTALHDMHVAMDAFRRGAFDYLLKPFQRKDLMATLQRAVEVGRKQRQSLLDLRDADIVVSERTQQLRSAMTDLEESYDVTLQAVGGALDLRDEAVEGHSKRVTAYSLALAKAIGVAPESLKMIARGAFLHDIGKIATPDAILLKPGKLTESETLEMQEHSQRGYDIVRKMPLLDEAAEIVLTHQERYDGTGYPRGLSGDEIPLGARIFAIADTLDAITSDRPYRKAVSFQEARAEIERCAGQQFDPQIVAAFLALPAELWSDICSKVAEGSVLSATLRANAA